MTEDRARQIVYARSAGICERCAAARATEWHHRQNRSQGGAWCPSNGLHLCPGCHRFVTRNPTRACAGGWSVPSGVDPATVPVASPMYGGLAVLLLPDGSLELLADCGAAA